MPADNELKFTAKLDVNPVIKAAKDLAKAISDATKVKTDNAVFAKGAEYLSRQSAEIRNINKGLAKEETYKKEIAAHNQKVAEWEQKRAELADLVRGRKYAQREVDERKGKAIGLYSGRTDKAALDNQEKLAEAQKRLANIDAEIVKTEGDIAKLETRLESSYNKIVKSEEASRNFTQQFESAGEAAQEIQNHAKGISDESYNTVSYIKEQRQAIRDVEAETKAYQKTAKDANQDVASSFEESSEKTSKSAKDSAQKAQEAFEAIKTARESLGGDWGLDFEADVTKMDDASLTRRRDELLSVANAFRAIKIPEEYADFFNRLNQALIETQTQLNNVHRDIKSSFDISNMKVPDLAADVTKMGEGELKNYKAELRAFMKALEGMGATTEQVYYDASLQLAKTDIQLKQVRADIKDVAMEQMGLKDEPIEIDLNADTASMHILQLISYFRQLKAEKERLLGIKDPTEEDSARYNTVVEKLNEADQALKNLGKDYEEIEEVAKESTTASQNFANSFKTFSDAFVGISQAGGFLQRIKVGLDAIGPAAVTAGLMSKEALTMATAGLNIIIEVVARVLSLFQSLADVAKNVAKGIWNAFKKVADMVKSVIENIKSGIDKIKTSLGKIFSFSGSDLKHTFQMLTKYIFGVRSFFFLYRKLRGAVKEGLENLVQFESASNETNHAITELRTSLLYLKNAWAAAFAPIINAVYPILVSFLDMLARVGNAIARFVAALTGQSTVLQALRVDAGDYADSLKDAAGGAGKAAKAQEELNDRLAAFDDLNVLGVDDDKNKTPSGGGGGGGLDNIDPNSMFERVKVKMDDFMRQLREAWFTGDGFELGQTFADAINRGLDNAHEWLTGEGREKILKIANLIGTTLDGVLSDGRLATNIGQVLADVFADAMLFINTVITPNRMYMIGMRIAETLNTAIPQIVPMIGETLGNLLRSAISNAWGFISNADFASWGVALGDAINNFFSQMSGKADPSANIKGTLSGWMLAGMSITEFANQIFNFLIEALNRVDWNEVGRAIGDFLGGIDFTEIKMGLQKLWERIKSALGDVLGGIGEANPKAGTALQPFVNSFASIYDTIQGLISVIPWSKIGELFVQLPTMLERITTAIENIGDILERVFGVVEEGINDFSDKLGHARNVIQDITDIQESTGMFGIAGVVLSAGRDMADGLNALMGVEVDTENRTRSLSDTFSDLAQNLFRFGEGGGGKFGAIPDSIRGMTESLKDTESVAGRVKTAMNFDSVANQIKGVATTSVTSLSEIPAKFTEIKGAADTQSVGIKDTFTTTFSNIKQESVDSAKMIQDNFLLASDNIKNSFIESWAEIKKSISEGGDMFVALSDGMGNTVKSLLNAMINGINISITKPLQDISKSFNVLRTLDVNGARPFAGIPYLNIPPIPHLAQGAVIPPNKQFMAVLGDQTSGTNIEAPLDTIKAAVGEEFAPYADMIVNAVLQVVDAVNNKPVLSDRDIGKANARFTSQQKLIRGTSL